MKKILINISIIVTFFFIILGVLWHFTYNGTPWDHYQFKTQVKSYLEKKYHEKMKINSIEYIFKQSIYYANVSLVDRPYISFSVYQNRDGTLRDGYFVALFEEQINKDLINYSNKIFNSSCVSQVNLSIFELPFKLNEYYENRKIPDFLAIRNRFTEPISYALNVNDGFKQNKSEEEYKKIYKVMDYSFNKYQLNKVQITFSNNVIFRIGYEDFLKIRSAGEISKYRIMNKTK